MPWDRQAITVTLRAALTTRYGTSARPVQMVMQGKKTKVVVQQKWRTVPALPTSRERAGTAGKEDAHTHNGFEKGKSSEKKRNKSK